MKKFLLYIWQLPQNVLGLLVILFTKAGKGWYKGSCIYVSSCSNFGVSLGNYIIFGIKTVCCTSTAVKHEQGHQRQSLYLGWLYLFIIGLPSVCGNVYDRCFHKNWRYKDRISWYYRQPWEHWADRLGGILWR